MEERRGGALWRTAVLAKHLRQATSSPVAADFLQLSGCLAYEPPEYNSGPFSSHESSHIPYFHSKLDFERGNPIHCNGGIGK